MARVPSSYATMVAEVETVEDWDPHNLKSDGAVVTMTAEVSGTQTYGYVDEYEIPETAQVSASDTYGRSDSATVSLVGVPSGSDERSRSDTGIGLLIAEVSATEVSSHTYTDAATASHTGVASGTDIMGSVDAARAILTAAIYSLSEEATVTMIARFDGTVSNDDTHHTADAATISTVGVTSTQWEVRKSVDDAVAILIAVMTALEEHTIFDSGTASLVGVPSGTDLLAHWYLDSATLTHTGIPSATESYGRSDDAIALLSAVITADDSLTHATTDDAIALLSAVITADEVYTQPPAHANETYIYAWGSSANGSSDNGSGGNAGGGSTWNLNRGNASRGNLGISTDENAHDITDLPVRTQDYIFFGSAPTNGYGAFFAVGDVSSVGVKTTSIAGKNNPPSAIGTTASATTSGYTLPSVPSTGDLVFVYVMTRSGVTAGTPTDASGALYTLVWSASSTGSVNHYLWKRLSVANDASFVVTSALSGSADWLIATLILQTPSSTTVYKMSEGAMVTSGSITNTLTAATHG